MWWAFACDGHVECLHAPRRLLDRDHAELARRREQRALALAGRPYSRTTPLAVGRTAQQRLMRVVAHHTAAAAAEPGRNDGIQP